jgi:hypothetical protein
MSTTEHKTLEGIKKLLNNYHIYPSSIIETRKEGNVLVGYHIDAPPILMADRIAYLKRLLGDDFICTPFTSEGFIKVTLKK